MLKEPMLEPVARYLRFHKALKEIDKQNIKILDIGCGPKHFFYHFLLKSGIDVQKYTGIDPLMIIKESKSIKVDLLNTHFDVSLPIKSESVDYAVALAVLEHVDNPKHLILEMFRVVKPGGKVLLTTPTPFAKYILEFLAYKLNLISKREIMEHKNYFNKRTLFELLKDTKGIKVYHNCFEFGLNNFLIISKS